MEYIYANFHHYQDWQKPTKKKPNKLLKLIRRWTMPRIICQMKNCKHNESGECSNWDIVINEDGYCTEYDIQDELSFTIPSL